MASAIHIPFEDLHIATRELLERAEHNGELFVDKKGVGFKIIRIAGRTASEALELIRNSPAADVEVDEDWANDMREIIALRHTVPDRDPWG
jgi:hypothetical protein